MLVVPENTLSDFRLHELYEKLKSFLMLSIQSYDFKRILLDLPLAFDRELFFVQCQTTENLSPSGFRASAIFFYVTPASLAKLAALFKKAKHFWFALRGEFGFLLSDAGGQAAFAWAHALAQGIGLLVAVVAERESIQAERPQAKTKGKRGNEVAH